MKKIILNLLFALFTTMSFAQVPNYVPTNDLVGWWPFNGNANDESGNGNNGTVNGATLTSDRNGLANKAYYFSSLNCATSIDINNLSFSNQPVGFSFSYWMKKIGNGCISPRLFEFGNGNTNNSWGSSWDNSGNLDYVNTALSNNMWYHIVNTFDGTTLKTYLNGNIESTYPLSKTLPFGNNVAFGRMNHPSYDAFNGEMDDLGVWDRVITDCEIKDLYNSQLGSGNTLSTQIQTALDTYTWPLNNQTYTQGGTYTATIPNAAGCDSVVTLNLTLNYTGINEPNSNLVSISPNPTSSIITVKSSLALIGEEYIIYDQQGKAVKLGIITAEETEIDLSNLSEGVYLFKAGTEMQETFKIIKQ